MKSPDEILADNAEVYRKKNEDYGDSWRKVGRILHEMADGELVTLETPEDWIRVGLYTRRLDKFLRTFNGEFRSNSMNFESIADNHEDESVYASMHSSTHQQDRENDESRTA